MFIKSRTHEQIALQLTINEKLFRELGKVAHVYNPHIEETEARGLYEFEAIQWFVLWSVLKRPKTLSKTNETV